jgi:hypothetical protein
MVVQDQFAIFSLYKKARFSENIWVLNSETVKPWSSSSVVVLNANIIIKVSVCL